MLLTNPKQGDIIQTIPKGNIKYARGGDTAQNGESRTEYKMKIEMKNYEISMSKAATVAEGMKSLPVFQTVRGANQWNAEKREQLINDLIAGKYIPPIAYGYVTDEDGNKTLAIMDGQQRGNAIREAVENGKLDPETEVLISIDKARDGAELFRVLNIGVPVGSALVTAVSLEGVAGQALLAVAEHKALDLVPWSAIQTGRTERAAFAATLIAIAAGWAMPESSTKACEAWLKEHAAEVDGEGKAAALAMADRIAAALAPYADTVAGEDKKRAKVARKVLGGVRKKNNWLTLCQLVNDDYSAEDAVALFADGEVWTKGGRYYPTAVQGGKRLKTATTIPMGGGSSGNAVDTAKRLDAAIYYLAEGGEFVRDPYAALDADADAKTARKAAEKAADIAPDALAAALGM